MDFDRWFAHQKPTEPEMLPDGVYDDMRRPGRLFGTCRVCEREVDVDPEWFKEGKFDALDLYCGRGPSCCP